MNRQESMRRHPAGKARPAPRPIRNHHAMTASEWALTLLSLVALAGVTYMVTRVLVAVIL